MTIQLISQPFDNIIGFKIEGKIEAKDIDYIVKSIEQKLKPGVKLRIYAEIENWSGMSLAAFIKDLKFSLQHFKDFEKEAIVSDQRWLKNLANVTNTLFSGIEVKHFNISNKEQAWEFIGS